MTKKCSPELLVEGRWFGILSVMRRDKIRKTYFLAPRRDPTFFAEIVTSRKLLLR